MVDRDWSTGAVARHRDDKSIDAPNDILANIEYLGFPSTSSGTTCTTGYDYKGPVLVSTGFDGCIKGLPVDSWDDVRNYGTDSELIPCILCGEEVRYSKKLNAALGGEASTGTTTDLQLNVPVPPGFEGHLPGLLANRVGNLPSASCVAEVIFRCVLCSDKEFATGESLAQHSMEKHPSGAASLTSIFNVPVSSTKVKHPSEVIHCVLCPEKFATAQALKAHTKAKHPSEVIIVLCPEKFATAQGLKAHAKAKHPSEVINSVLCPEKFVTAQALKAHTKAKHPSEVINCVLCPEKFATAQALKAHTKATHPSEVINCALCPEKFAGAAGLEAHIKAKHPSELNHCVHCPEKTFASAQDLKAHITAKHSSEVTHCALCPGKKFSGAQALKDHSKAKHPQETVASTLRGGMSGAHAALLETGTKSVASMSHSQSPPGKPDSSSAATPAVLLPKPDRACGSHRSQSTGCQAHQGHIKEKYATELGNGLQFCCQICGRKLQSSSALVRHAKVHWRKAQKEKKMMQKKNITDINNNKEEHSKLETETNGAVSDPIWSRSDSSHQRQLLDDNDDTKDIMINVRKKNIVTKALTTYSQASSRSSHDDFKTE